MPLGNGCQENNCMEREKKVYRREALKREKNGGQIPSGSLSLPV
jgi:hypothetical protein